MAGDQWIWTSSAWPRLTYDNARLAEPLRRAQAECGRLFGKAEAPSPDAPVVTRPQKRSASNGGRGSGGGVGTPGLFGN